MKTNRLPKKSPCDVIASPERARRSRPSVNKNEIASLSSSARNDKTRIFPQPAKLTFVLGGARSGKSTHAAQLAKQYGKVAFIATCIPQDSEMRKRVRLHRQDRPKSWKTYEEPRDLTPLLKRIHSDFEVILIDCLTILISNLLLDGGSDKSIEEKIAKLIRALKSAKCHSIMVSNEVGLGIVPNHPLGRRFRDLAGRINQLTAREANEVVFMVSGLPMQIKGKKK